MGLRRVAQMMPDFVFGVSLSRGSGDNHSPLSYLIEFGFFPRCCCCFPSSLWSWRCNLKSKIKRRCALLGNNPHLDLFALLIASVLLFISEYIAILSGFLFPPVSLSLGPPALLSLLLLSCVGCWNVCLILCL